MMSSREKVFISVIVVLLVFSIGGVSWYFFTGKGKTKADSLALSPPSGNGSSATDKVATSTPSSPDGSSSGNSFSAPEASFSEVQLSLSEGDNLVTVPAYLSPNDGKTVFSGNTGVVAYLLDSEGKWVALSEKGSITPGQGIWIISDKTITLPISVVAKPVSTSKPFSITLNKGWNAIGNPFPTEITWDPQVKTSQGTTSFSKAVEAKIITVGYFADSVNKVYKTVSAGDKVKPSEGILIKSGGEKVELIISSL